MNRSVAIVVGGVPAIIGVLLVALFAPDLATLTVGIAMVILPAILLTLVWAAGRRRYHGRHRQEDLDGAS